MLSFCYAGHVPVASLITCLARPRGRVFLPKCPKAETAPLPGKGCHAASGAVSCGGGCCFMWRATLGEHGRSPSHILCITALVCLPFAPAPLVVASAVTVRSFGRRWHFLCDSCFRSSSVCILYPFADRRLVLNRMHPWK
jgi:hypothetical protein